MKRQPQGIVLLTVLAALAAGMVLLGFIARAVVHDHQQIRARHDDRQCRRLATAGVERGLARLAADPEYTGETWDLPEGELGGSRAARVAIRIEPEVLPAGQTPPRLLLATAEYPAGPTARIRHTERRPLPSAELPRADPPQDESPQASQPPTE